MKQSNKKCVDEYVDAILSGRKIACPELVQACQRYKDDSENTNYEFRSADADFVINLIEKTFTHKQGERLDGSPLRGEPFLLEPFHKFIILNLLGFYKAGTNIRKYNEAMIYIPRKNIKTTFAAALAYALGILERKSGSTIYIVAASMKQALQSFDFCKFNIESFEEDDIFKIIDNNNEHSITGTFSDGSFYIEALAANPDAQDSFNCNIAIADECHAFKKPKQYNLFKEAMKAYTNKLMIGISTAGDNVNSFWYRRVQYGKKVLNGSVKDEQLFVFMTAAPQSENGDVDYTNPVVHEMANPAYGVSIRKEDIMNDALQAQNDPQQRKDFLAKSLNVYTSALRAYFNIDEFKSSDSKYDWTLSQLTKIPKLYGGSDLSKMHDLTASCLVGLMGEVLVIIPHCWFPRTAAYKKADEDSIPLFGWQDDGWLTMSNNPTVNHAEIVKWYEDMKAKGFKIRQVGHDRKFCREYFMLMKRKGFKIVDQPQYYYKKSEGFRYIEKKAKDGLLYYMHAEPFEYCVQNVHAIEKVDDMVMYEKVEETQRIDIFDAAVFAVVRMLEDMENASAHSGWVK